MKSKRSFFKRPVVRQDFRQHGWISIVYLLCLLFTIPLGLLQIASREYEVFSDYQNYLMINTEIQVLLYFLIPVAAGLLLFRYIHNEASVDMIHSLPIRRETLYISHIISGLLLLIVPIILSAIITFFVANSIEGFNEILTVSDLLSGTGLITLLTCMMFAFSIAVGFITGMTTAQAILTYILLFLPIGMVSVVSYNLTFLLFGFTPMFIEEKLMYFSPFLRFVGYMGEVETYSNLEIFMYIILMIFFFVIGLVLYKNRQLERATDVIAFGFMKPIFKYGMTFCSMILGGTYFSASGSLNWSWIIFGYITGALIGYTVSEIILHKTWRILSPRFFVGFVVYSIVFIGVLFSIKMDLIHYESKLPRMDQIKEVYFGHRYEMEELMRFDKDPYSTSKLYIQDVRNLHEEIINQKDFIESYKETNEYTVQYLITYRLNNGKQFSREYQLPQNALQNELKPIMESEDYKLNLPEFYQLQREDVINISLVPYGPGQHMDTVTITDKKEIEEFRKEIEEDILSESVEDMISTVSPWAYINIEYNRNHNEQQVFEGYTVDWKKSYDHITTWLDKHGYLEQSRIDENDIEKAEMTIVNSKNQPEFHGSEEMYQTGEKHVTFTEKEALSSIITNFTEYSTVNTYYVKLTLKDGNEWYGSISDKNVTEEMKNSFK